MDLLLLMLYHLLKIMMDLVMLTFRKKHHLLKIEMDLLLLMLYHLLKITMDLVMLTFRKKHHLLKIEMHLLLLMLYHLLKIKMDLLLLIAVNHLCKIMMDQSRIMEVQVMFLLETKRIQMTLTLTKTVERTKQMPHNMK